MDVWIFYEIVEMETFLEQNIGVKKMHLILEINLMKHV